MSPNSPLHLHVVLFEGFSNMVLASTLEPLRVANALSGRVMFSWALVTKDGGPVTSSSGLSLAGDHDLMTLGPASHLVVVAGYGMRAQATRPVLAALRRAARGAQLIAGHDTGAWLLAQANLLDGYTATIHWMEQAAFREKFPRIAAATSLYCRDRSRVTTGAARGAMAFALDLIGEQGDPVLRRDVRLMFDTPLPEPPAVSDSHPPLSAPEGLSPPLTRAVQLMQQRLETPLPLAAVAAEAAVSQRTLERLFQKAFGLSAGRYYQHLRLARAQFLASADDLPLAEIALRTGFSSAATLARAYRATFGKTLRGKA